MVAQIPHPPPADNLPSLPALRCVRGACFFPINTNTSKKKKKRYSVGDDGAERGRLGKNVLLRS